MEFVREGLKTLPVAVRLLPDERVRSLTSYASSARQRVLAIEIQRAPLSTAERAVKRGMDRRHCGAGSDLLPAGDGADRDRHQA